MELIKKFSNEEKKVMEHWKPNITILDSIKNKCYALCENGEYAYDGCLKMTSTYYTGGERYTKMIPRRMITIYQYYIMEAENELNCWYVGEMDKDGNLVFWGYWEDLYDALSTL